MIVQILAVIFSLSGYYFIARNPKLAYISFILLNGILLISTFQIALILNSIFSGYFLYKLIKRKKSRPIINWDEYYKQQYKK